MKQFDWLFHLVTISRLNLDQFSTHRKSGVISGLKEGHHLSTSENEDFPGMFEDLRFLAKMSRPLL